MEVQNTNNIHYEKSLQLSPLLDNMDLSILDNNLSMAMIDDLDFNISDVCKFKEKLSSTICNKEMELIGHQQLNNYQEDHKITEPLLGSDPVLSEGPNQFMQEYMMDLSENKNEFNNRRIELPENFSDQQPDESHLYDSNDFSVSDFIDLDEKNFIEAHLGTNSGINNCCWNYENEPSNSNSVMSSNLSPTQYIEFIGDTDNELNIDSCIKSNELSPLYFLESIAVDEELSFECDKEPITHYPINSINSSPTMYSIQYNGDCDIFCNTEEINNSIQQCPTSENIKIINSTNSSHIHSIEFNGNEEQNTLEQECTSVENISDQELKVLYVENDSFPEKSNDKFRLKMLTDSEKYRRIRDQNNVASRKSRMKKKDKLCQNTNELNDLESENEELKKKYARLKVQRDLIKKLFSKYIKAG